MLKCVTLQAADRAEQLRRLCNRALAFAEVSAAVAEIIAAVRTEGDAAVRRFTQKWEGRTLSTLEVSPAEWSHAITQVDPLVRAALVEAHARIVRFHQPQVSSGYVMEESGVRLELRVQPLSRVGLYVPGGSARYPSSVLMCAVPAKLAGVGEIIMVTPGPSAETLCAAQLAGVDRVLVIGGAQAVAALAFGTESVPRVDKIVGPGNAYVAEAKRQLFGTVDIDQVAGPSEVLIVADSSANPKWVAADLLAQAEHDADAWAVLVTPAAELVAAVETELSAQLAGLPRRAIAERALSAHGAAVLVRSLPEALEFVDAFAPEHLELQVAQPEPLAQKVRHAGAIFLGAHTPEAAGDYLAGPNHVLPTSGAARFGSPLGVYDFVRRTSLLHYQPEALSAQAPHIERLAEVEGLQAHARAVSLRRDAR